MKQQKTKVRQPKPLQQVQHKQLKQLKRKPNQPKQQSKSKQQPKQQSLQNVHASGNSKRNDTTIHSDLLSKFESMFLSLQKQIADQNKIISKLANKNGS